MIVLTSEESVRHILSTNFNNYVKGKEFQAWLSEFLGNGVFASDGVVWKHHRKVASNMFSRRLLRHTLAVGYDVGLEMIGRLKKLVEQGRTRLQRNGEDGGGGGDGAAGAGTTVVDVQDIFFRFTIDIFTLVAFGVELNSFQRDDQHPFAKAFDDIQRNVIKRVPNACWRVSKCLRFSQVEQTIYTSAEIIDNFANEVIAQKRRAAKVTNINGNEELGPDLISRFLEPPKKKRGEEKDPPPPTMTNKELRDIVLNFMIAGRDTTACALTWCVYELARNPQYGSMIREETLREGILSTKGRGRAGGRGSVGMPWLLF